MTEYHHGVASLYLRVTVDEHAYTVTYQSANGSTSGQSQFLNEFLGDARAFRSCKLCHFRIDEHQRAQVIDIGFQQHLEDMAGGDGLLVDDGADVQFLCHLHIVEILHHSHL